MEMFDLLTAFRAVAPEHLAESWDKVGLHTGSDDDAQVTAGMLCIDLTHAVIDEALEKGCQLIIAYHPPIFSPLTHMRNHGPWSHTRIVRCVREGLNVYSPHTALDAVRGGMNDWLCEGLGANSSTPIAPAGAKRDEYKLAVFVPNENEIVVRRAMFDAGAGWIGKYNECSFSASGEGGFKPLEGANPSIGDVGKRESVLERRLEVIVRGAALAKVVAALRQAHPYEEPAIDIFKLEPEPVVAEQQAGPGRFAFMETDAATLAERVKQLLGLDHVKLADGGESIRSVAVCPGAGGKLFESVAADAYVTGEMQHHHVLDLQQSGKTVVLAGHTNTERPFLPVYRDQLVAAGADIAWHISEADRAPMAVV